MIYCYVCLCNTVITDAVHIRFWLVGYLADFYYPIPIPDPAEMLKGIGYHNRIFYCQCDSIRA